MRVLCRGGVPLMPNLAADVARDTQTWRSLMQEYEIAQA